MASQVIPTICGVCHVNCGLDVTVSAGQIQEIRGTRQHPANRGALCIKGYASKEILTSSRRLTRPLMKQRNRQIPVSWEEALSAIAGKLQDLCARWGPQTLVNMRGAPVTEEVREGLLRLACTLGSPNLSGSSHLCAAPRDTGLRSVIGGSDSTRHRPRPHHRRREGRSLAAASPGNGPGPGSGNAPYDHRGRSLR